jgi:hypothetical protein
MYILFCTGGFALHDVYIDTGIQTHSNNEFYVKNYYTTSWRSGGQQRPPTYRERGLQRLLAAVARAAGRHDREMTYV